MCVRVYHVWSILDSYEAQIREVVPLHPSLRFPRFDLVLLGMGPDGHTASLFPSHPLLAVIPENFYRRMEGVTEEEKEDDVFVSYLTDSPKPPPSRITLTLPTILAAKDVFFVVTGEGKADAISHIFQPSEEGKVCDSSESRRLDLQLQPSELFPASLIQPVDGQVVWFVDEPAVSQLH